MKKWYVIFAILAVLFGYGIARAGDVGLKWDAAIGVTGYKVYMSTDVGVTWLAPKDVGNVITYTYVGIVEDRLIMFKISAYNATGESITHWAGAWYDGRKKPPQFAVNLGIQ